MPEVEGKFIGKISHYFGKIGVAVIDLEGDLKVGDKIRIAGGEIDSEELVESMEVDHKKVKTAKSGDSVGLKIGKKARKDYKVYKI